MTWLEKRNVDDLSKHPACARHREWLETTLLVWDSSHGLPDQVLARISYIRARVASQAKRERAT